MNNYYGRNGTVPSTLQNNMIIDRDFSLTQQQDYNKNILPYKKTGYQIEVLGEHMYGYFVVKGWRMSYTGSNKN